MLTLAIGLFVISQDNKELKNLHYSNADIYDFAFDVEILIVL